MYSRPAQCSASTRLVEAEVLDDREPVGPGGRRVDHGAGELLVGETEVGGHPRQAVASEAGVEVLAQLLVAAQVRGEQGPHAGQLAVVAGAREEMVEGVDDLVVAAAARPAAAGHRHGQPGEHERIGEDGQEGVVLDPVAATRHRLGGRAGEADREPVDLLAALAPGELPVGDRR
jgi:hypothetical protein